jgi:hypothetical protein
MSGAELQIRTIRIIPRVDQQVAKVRYWLWVEAGSVSAQTLQVLYVYQPILAVSTLYGVLWGDGQRWAVGQLWRVRRESPLYVARWQERWTI